MVLRFLIGALGITLLSFLAGAICWVVFGEGWGDLRRAWRARQAKKAERREKKFNVEWSPRLTAYRHVQQAKIVGIDQVSRAHRMKQHVQ